MKQSAADKEWIFSKRSCPQELVKTTKSASSSSPKAILGMLANFTVQYSYTKNDI